MAVDFASTGPNQRRDQVLSSRAFLRTFPLVAQEAHDVRIPVLISLLAGFPEGTFVPESSSLIAPDRRTVEIEDFQVEAVQSQFHEPDPDQFPDGSSPVPLSPQIGRTYQDAHNLSTEVVSIDTA